MTESVEQKGQHWHQIMVDPLSMLRGLHIMKATLKIGCNNTSAMRQELQAHTMPCISQLSHSYHNTSASLRQEASASLRQELQAHTMPCISQLSHSYHNTSASLRQGASGPHNAFHLTIKPFLSQYLSKLETRSFRPT